MICNISITQVRARGCDLFHRGSCIHCIYQNSLYSASVVENTPDSRNMDKRQKNLQQLIWNILYQINRSYHILTIQYILSKIRIVFLISRLVSV